MSAITQQLFISVRGFLVILGKEEDQELLLFDPGIKSVLKTFTESNKFGRDKIAFCAETENFISQSNNKSVLSYFNVQTKEAVFKNGTQEKLESLCLTSKGDLCFGGSINGNLFVWNAFTGEMIAKLICKTRSTRNDRKLMMLCADNRVLVYDLDKLRLLALTHQIENANIKPQFTFSPHKKMILDARIPEGCSDLLLTLGLDNSVKVMDLESGEQVGELFLEDTPSCFCTDYLGQVVFVGFADGRIRKYRYKKKSYDIGLLVDPDNTENITAGLEKQEEKALLQVSHKSKVTSMVYVPELKEVISSGTDDMLFMFTSEGVTTYTTGKYKKNFDFMNLVQRPKALYSSTNFGATLTKTKMFFKPLQKTTSESATQSGPKLRTYARPNEDTTPEQPDDLNRAKIAKKRADFLLKSFEDARGEKTPTMSGLSKTPTLKKREIEELESEISELKIRLEKMANFNRGLLKRVTPLREEG